jgi:hypothetical protein
MDADWILSEDALLAHVDESGVNLLSVMKAPGPLTSRIALKRLQNETAKLSAPGWMEHGFRVQSLGETLWRVDCFNLGGAIGSDLKSKVMFKDCCCHLHD